MRIHSLLVLTINAFSPWTIVMSDGLFPMNPNHHAMCSLTFYIWLECMDSKRSTVAKLPAHLPIDQAVLGLISH